MATEIKKTVKVTLPLLDGENASQEVFVGLNGKAYRIKRGEEVELPVGVYDEIMRAQTARDNAIRAKKRLAVREPAKQQ